MGNEQGKTADDAGGGMRVNHDACMVFDFAEIRRATDNFSPKNKLGQGGSGTVYKGMLRATAIAVKELTPRGVKGSPEFVREVEILAKLRHRHVLSLHGCAYEGDRCVLVYEFQENGSVDDRLGCKDGAPPLDWQTRLRIATGACKGLLYMHGLSPPIFHCDFKSANLLLDMNNVPKVSDFGLSRFMPEFQSDGASRPTHVTMQPFGTYGYICPEFARTGHLTDKVDVFSFGVVLLELITSLPAINPQERPVDLAQRAEEFVAQGRELYDLRDKRAGEWPREVVRKLGDLALKCVQLRPKDRPNFNEVLYELLLVQNDAGIPDATIDIESLRRMQMAQTKSGGPTPSPAAGPSYPQPATPAVHHPPQQQHNAPGGAWATPGGAAGPGPGGGMAPSVSAFSFAGPSANPLRGGALPTVSRTPSTLLSPGAANRSRSGQGTTMTPVNVTSMKMIKKIKVPMSYTHVAAIADRLFLSVDSPTGEIHIYDQISGERIHADRLSHTSQVFALASYCNKLYSCCRDRLLCWDPEASVVAGEVCGAKLHGGIYATCMCIGDGIVYVGDAAGHVRMFDSQDLSQLGTAQVDARGVYAVSAWGERLATVGASRGDVKVWEARTLEWIGDVAVANISMLRLDGNFLSVVSEGSQEVAVYDISLPKICPPLTGHKGRITCLASNIMQILTASDDKFIRAYDLLKSTLMGTQKGHKAYVRCMVVHRGRLISHGGDNIKIWS